VLHRLIRLLAWVWTRLLNDRARTDIMWWLNAKLTVGVVGLIFDDAGRVLLIEHGSSGAPRWELPGGCLRRRDTPEEALARHVAEQAGLAVEVEETLAAELAGRLHLEVVYRCHLTGRTSRPDHAGRCRWCHPTDLPPGLAPRAAQLIALATTGLETYSPVESISRS